MIKPDYSCSFLEKKKYFNFFHMNVYLCLFTRGGASKLLKKSYLKWFYFHKYFTTYGNSYLFKGFSFKEVITNFLLGKRYNVFFSPTTTLTYFNHRKKYVSKLNYTITKKKKRNIFFLRFTKYFFFKKNWKKNVKNFMLFDLNSRESVIYDCYKSLINKFVLKK